MITIEMFKVICTYTFTELQKSFASSAMACQSVKMSLLQVLVLLVMGCPPIMFLDIVSFGLPL